MDGRILCVSERVYRALLVVYPKEFRDAYGPQMVQAFGDLCRESVERGGSTGLIALWIRTLVNLASTAVVERVRRHAGIERLSAKDRKMAGVGFVALSTPLFFVAASLLKYGLGVGLLFDPLDRALMSDPERLRVFNLVSPVVFLGGLGLALLLNVYAVLRLNLSREDGTIVSTVRVEMKLANIVVVVVSSLLLGTLVGYFFLENFAYRP